MWNTHYRIMRHAWCCAVTAFVCYVGVTALAGSGSGSPHTRPSNDEVIALIGDTTIRYKDIKELPEILPATAPSEEAQIEAVRREELTRLAGKIYNAIVEQTAKVHGITVSQEAIDARVEEIFRSGKVTDDTARRLRVSMLAVCEALEAWQRGDKNVDALFKQYLEHTQIGRSQWDAWRSRYDTPEKLKQLKESVPADLQEMKRISAAAARRDVLHRKVVEWITKDISVSDSEVLAEYQRRYPNAKARPPLGESLRTAMLNDIRAAREGDAVKEYMRKEIASGKVKVHGDFRYAVDILVGCNLSTLPTSQAATQPKQE